MSLFRRNKKPDREDEAEKPHPALRAARELASEIREEASSARVRIERLDELAQELKVQVDTMRHDAHFQEEPTNE